MDWDREQSKRRYALCRAGFVCISLGLGLLCISDVVSLAFYFTRNQEIWTLTHSPAWEWLVSAPITWGTLIGAYLLWGRSTNPSWQRQAGTLVILNFIDFILWMLHHADYLGLKTGAVGHLWFRGNLAEATGWVEFLLFASLATETVYSLGKSDAAEAGMAARSISTIGIVFWVITFFTLTNWRRGWPLEQLPVRRVDADLIIIGSQLLSMIAAFQVTFLTVTASRYCARALAQMAKEDRGEELLRSASESYGDDPRDWFSRGDDQQGG